MQGLEASLTKAVRAAGDAALAMSRAGFRRWLKPDGTPVTQADLTADAILREHLGEALPDAGWQSEESAAAPPAQGRYWLADPIDGTASFARGDSGWCVAVALIENHRPVLAAIYAPAMDMLWLAGAGRGAFRNGAPILASTRERLEGARLIANSSTLAPERWARPFPPVERASLHAMQLRLCFVGEARQDATIAIGPKQDWDLAAGDLIVSEAGGRVSDLQGQPLRYGIAGMARSGLVAAGAGLHAEIIALTAPAREI